MDYAAALERHYRGNPSEARWEGRFVSNYAMAHPWEDWAETFAHYLHIRGTLQTAAAYGVVVAGPAVTRGTAVGGSLVSNPSDEDQVGEPFANILADWLPLTYALNELNRSIGRPPLYPFVLAPPVIDKLSLVHELVHDVSESTPVGV